MVQSQYSISWDSFNASICGGFSSLQQNGELVDMTLAADGHFVKVHQVLMALVSPYLKQLITSAPCQHPVIFLNNVSHKTLSLLLEYVYTGEVSVPTDHLAAFTQTAQALHIKGLEQFSNSRMFVKTDPTTEGRSSSYQPSGTKRPADPTYRQTSLPAKAKNVTITDDSGQIKSYSPVTHEQQTSQSNDGMLTEMVDYSILDSTIDQDSDDDMAADSQSETTAAGDSKDINQASRVQFTVSIRGSLQVILNRYIYNFHSIQNRVGKRRWRCVNYRDQRCPAFVVTNGNVVLSRGNPHNHGFHDKKILQKIEKKAVFTAIEEVEGYKDSLKEMERKYDSYGETNADPDDPGVDQDDDNLSDKKLKVEIV